MLPRSHKSVINGLVKGVAQPTSGQKLRNPRNQDVMRNPIQVMLYYGEYRGKYSAIIPCGMDIWKFLQVINSYAPHGDQVIPKFRINDRR